MSTKSSITWGDDQGDALHPYPHHAYYELMDGLIHFTAGGYVDLPWEDVDVALPAEAWRGRAAGILREAGVPEQFVDEIAAAMEASPRLTSRADSAAGTRPAGSPEPAS